MQASVPGQVQERGALVGIVAFAPLVIGVALAAAVFFAPEALLELARRVSFEWPGWFTGYVVASVAHALGFAAHAWGNERLRGSPRRWPWVLALAMAAGLAAPVYWCKGLTRRGG